MEQTKPWYASKGIWINLIQAILGIAIAGGFVTADQATSWMDSVNLWIGTVITLLGFGGAFARIAASKTVVAPTPLRAIIPSDD